MAGTKAFMVAYDVSGATATEYKAIETALERHGTLNAVQKSAAWISDSGSTAQAIFNSIVSAVPGRTATIWVTEAALDRAFSK